MLRCVNGKKWPLINAKYFVEFEIFVSFAFKQHWVCSSEDKK